MTEKLIGDGLVLLVIDPECVVNLSLIGLESY